MDQSEHIAKNYLESCYSSVRYEPDGNIPPDFLIDNNIAVEVRRLNQNKSFGGNIKGLDEESIPLFDKVEKLLESLGSPRDDASWFVLLQFSRPLPNWKVLRKQLRTKLEHQMHQPYIGIIEIPFSERFFIRIVKGSKKYDTHYCMGGGTDMDSGGWLLSELESNIEFCAIEKAKKIAKYRSRYNQWWLILVDHIAYSMDKFERELWNEKKVPMHGWNKIILLDPLENNSAIEI